MTISPLADETARDDAALARAAATGDRAAFAAIYDRYTDRLYDFCVGMLRDRDAAADCVQDVFVIAATRLAQLREQDRLRSWLYAIARNEALNRIQRSRYEHLSNEFPDMASTAPGLDTLAGRSELAALINDACGGLSDRDRTVFELAYRHGLDGPELADALGVSHTNANTLLGRLRDTIERSLGALLVSRRAKAVPNACSELRELLADWDGRFTVLMRKRVARHIDNCPSCDDERRRLVNPVALLGGAPVFIPAPAWLRSNALAQFPSAIGHAAAQASGSSIHSALPQQSWWPPSNFNTSDLVGPGTAPPRRMHSSAGQTKRAGPQQPAKASGPDKALGSPSAAGPTQFGGAATVPGADKQLGPAPKQLSNAPTTGPTKINPKFLGGSGGPPRGPKTLNTDSGHGHLGGRLRTALLVALVVVGLGTVAALGTVLARQMWPPTTPAQTPIPAPAATSARVSTSSPASPSTPLPTPTTAFIAPPVPASTQRSPATHAPTPPDYTTQIPTSVHVAPAPSLPTAVISTAVPPTSDQPQPPAPVQVQIPDSAAGGSSNSPGAGGSGGSSNPAPAASGGGSTGSGSTGSSGSGSSSGSPPVVKQKVFGGSGPNLNNCPIFTGCPTASNGTNGIH